MARCDSGITAFALSVLLQTPGLFAADDVNAPRDTVFVHEGKARAVREIGAKRIVKDGALEGRGKENSVTVPGSGCLSESLFRPRKPCRS